VALNIDLKRSFTEPRCGLTLALVILTRGGGGGPPSIDTPFPLSIAATQKFGEAHETQWKLNPKDDAGAVGNDAALHEPLV
jgi:hypothetical protein